MRRDSFHGSLSCGMKWNEFWPSADYSRPNHRGDIFGERFQPFLHTYFKGCSANTWHRWHRRFVMSPVTHPHPQPDELAAFVSGQAPEEAATAISQHLADC